jgi:hypothetical protein
MNDDTMEMMDRVKQIVVKEIDKAIDEKDKAIKKLSTTIILNKLTKMRELSKRVELKSEEDFEDFEKFLRKLP